MGLLFLRSGRAEPPDQTKLDAYAPQRRDHWPSSPDITTAMLAHLQKPQM